MKKKIFLVVLLFVLGMWMGINIAKNKPLLSNPFAEKDIRDKATGTAKELLEDARGAVKKSLEESKK